MLPAKLSNSSAANELPSWSTGSSVRWWTGWSGSNGAKRTSGGWLSPCGTESISTVGNSFGSWSEKSGEYSSEFWPTSDRSSKCRSSSCGRGVGCKYSMTLSNRCERSSERCGSPSSDGVNWEDGPWLISWTWSNRREISSCAKEGGVVVAAVAAGSCAGNSQSSGELDSFTKWPSDELGSEGCGGGSGGGRGSSGSSASDTVSVDMVGMERYVVVTSSPIGFPLVSLVSRCRAGSGGGGGGGGGSGGDVGGGGDPEPTSRADGAELRGGAGHKAAAKAGGVCCSDIQSGDRAGTTGSPAESQSDVNGMISICCLGSW